MILEEALLIAERIKAEMAPHCERLEIAGSIRRKKPEVKDIEIVAIAKPYEIDMFEDGLASVVNKWEKVKGNMQYGKCKYTQRILPDGIKLDLFFAEPGNWGLIYAIRTGSADYSHRVLASGWVKRGYKSIEGYIHSGERKIETPEEEDLFRISNVEWVEPEMRNL